MLVVALAANPMLIAVSASLQPTTSATAPPPGPPTARAQELASATARERGNRACIFCTAELTFNLTSLPRATYELHSGIRGTYEYETYVATSPCASSGTSDLCFSGPSADPFALALLPDVHDTPICRGLGSLDNAEVTAAPGRVSIRLHDNGTKGFPHSIPEVVFNVTCDPEAPLDNPPDDAVVLTKDPHKVYTITWRHPSACSAAPTPPGGCSAPAPPAPAVPTCEGCLPQWKPTWSMARSTALYGCNSSGPHNLDEAAAYGIVVYDWSHQKLQWANNRPMNDDELLLEQAERVLARDPGVPGEQPKVWVYRNKIKALPWIGQVREKLDDPAYAGWFVPFNSSYRGRASNNSFHVPPCDWYGDEVSGPPKCSRFYHDSRPTPTKYGAGLAYTPPAHDHPAHNVCREQCDCGANPCGEYTFDHRNASFADWWVNEYMISEQTLKHRPLINLGWLDDSISLNGMSEGAPLGTWVMDTGSSPQDMQDHTDAFRHNIARLQRAIHARGGFYWQMIQGSGPEVRPVSKSKHGQCHKPLARNVSAAQCAATLREWCAPRPEAWRIAHLYTVCAGEMVEPDLARDATAEFLLTRGDYAWLGYSWSGCEAFHGANATWLRPRPALWDADFGGAPAGPCAETAVGSGVFTRAYPRADVSWDCATGRGEIAWRG